VVAVAVTEQQIAGPSREHYPRIPGATYSPRSFVTSTELANTSASRLVVNRVYQSAHAQACDSARGKALARLQFGTY
jgi:hypothetical protein